MIRKRRKYESNDYEHFSNVWFEMHETLVGHDATAFIKGPCIKITKNKGKKIRKHLKDQMFFFHTCEHFCFEGRDKFNLKTGEFALKGDNDKDVYVFNISDVNVLGYSLATYRKGLPLPINN